MNKKEYNQVIEWTLANDPAVDKADSVVTTRAILKNMGVAFPHGDLANVKEVLETNDYMGWRKCTAEEAQKHSNDGTAVVSASESHIIVIAAEPEQGETDIDTNSNAAMASSANTSAFTIPDSVFYANFAAGTTVPARESVTIMYDQTYGYAKVEFDSSGKIWHCIGCDLIYTDNYGLYNLYDRMRYNMYVDGESGEFQDYSIAEMKLLYAIDPYGFAYYIKNFAERAIVDTSLAGIIAYKDFIFEVLFGREPKYYARDINGEWYQTQSTSNLTHILSESEIYFGMHQLWDWVTYRHMIEFGIDILSIIFSTSLFNSCAFLRTVKNLYLTSVMICSVGEAVLKNEILSYAAGFGIENALEATNLGWVSAVTTIVGGIDAITADLTAEPNYCDKIIDYCVNLNQFNINVQSIDGHTYLLQSIRNALN